MIVLNAIILVIYFCSARKKFISRKSEVLSLACFNFYIKLNKVAMF